MRPNTERTGLWSDPYVLAALAAAVAARGAFAVALPAAHFAHIRRYVEPAADLLGGRWLSPSLIDQLPGAPLVFAFCFLVFGQNFAAAALLQHLLGLATVGFLAAAAWRAWGAAPARWTAWLLALQLVIPFQERFLLSECVAEFFLALALYGGVLLRWDAPLDWRPWALCGAAAGMAALSRGELLGAGPLLAAALAWPGGGLEARPRLARAGVFFASWVLLVGGWRLHNQLGGFPGFNAHGPTCLLDSAMPLIRYDLPTQSLAKGLLREEEARCASRPPGCNPRQAVYDRLQRDHGYSFLDAQWAVGEVGREAIFTQPARYWPMFRENFLAYLRPMAWVDEERWDPDAATAWSRSRGEAFELFWRRVECGPQYFGWLPAVLVLALPLALWGAPAAELWLPAVLAGLILGVDATASFFRAVARTQAELYLPMALLAGRAAAFLVGVTGRRASRSRPR